MRAPPRSPKQPPKESPPPPASAKESPSRPPPASAEDPSLQRILPDDWGAALGAELRAPYFAELVAFTAAERAHGTVYPPPDQVFTALQLTPLAQVRVVILGQDPYHGPGQAHGLAFSVLPGVKPPPSLRNMFKELQTDLGVAIPEGAGCLTGWAKQGVLLLNTVLTVRAGAAGSHRGHGWERFTDAVIKAVAALPVPPVFVLWGAPAHDKTKLLSAGHLVIKSAHPSPLSAWNGFFGSRPFSAVNQALVGRGQAPIDWSVVI